MGDRGMTIRHEIVPLAVVMEFFSRGFLDQKGYKIKHCGEVLVDTAKGKVVFELFVEETEKSTGKS